ncbi:MAG: exodeoxyribonuclease VII small subunit [candidate division BRC1 bacterium ADurb.BinA364]|nr:MAG: exodeoxyribonuclease VII small subunit [candidate division BRC1 bacterium ADurb.BinA364]
MAKSASFETSLQALEKIVEKLDDARFCEKKLTEVESKIQTLLEKEKGEFALEDFEPDGAEEREPSFGSDFPG